MGPCKSTAGSSATLHLHIAWVEQCTRHGYFCLYYSQQLYNRGGEHNVCSGEPRGKQDCDRTPCRSSLSLKRGGVIGRTIRRCSEMETLGTSCFWKKTYASFSAEFRMSPHAVRRWMRCNKDIFFPARPWEQRNGHYKAQLLLFGYRI